MASLPCSKRWRCGRVLFFDITCPAKRAGRRRRWPTPIPAHQPFPALVFVTAYDQYAVQALWGPGRGLSAQACAKAHGCKNSTKLRLALYPKSASRLLFQEQTQALKPRPQRKRLRWSQALQRAP